MKKQFGKGLVLAVVGTAALVGGGTLAYKYVFARTGELAASLLPADAILVVTIDTNPSERQLKTFTEISDVLKDAKFGENLDFMTDKLIKNDQLASKLRPYLTQNMAFGGWRTGEKKFDGAAIISIDNPGKVSEIISGSKKTKEVALKVIDRYLIIASDATVIARIEDVKAGRSEAVTKTDRFVAARKSLPEDANFMLFFESEKLQKAMQASMESTKSLGYQGFCAMSATVEPDGLAFHQYGETKFPSKEIEALYNDLRPIRTESILGMPNKAYGIFAFTGIDKYVRTIEKSFSQDETLGSTWTDGVQNIEQSSGLSVEGDILPALEGTFVVGGYPGAGEEGKDFDLVMAIQHDDPAKLAEVATKLRNKISEAAAESKDVSEWTESTFEGAKLWTLKRAVPAETSSLMDQKTMVYAEAKDGLVLGSSEAVVKRALQSKNGIDDLSSDPGFTTAFSKGLKSSLFTMTVNFPRIMKAFEPALRESMKDRKEIADDLMKLFGDAMISTMTYEKGVTKMYTFLPLDWSAFSQLVGGAMKSAKESDEKMDRAMKEAEGFEDESVMSEVR